MIGTMGSFKYPSADLNDPLYVLLKALPPSLVAESKPQDMFGIREACNTLHLCCDCTYCLDEAMLTRTCSGTAIFTV